MRVVNEDQEWVSQVLAGHTYSYAHLVNKYKGRLCALLVSMGNSQADAEDIAQTAFVNAYKHLKKYDPERSFSAWLYRIAVNLSVSQWRTQKNRQWTELQETLVAVEPTPEDIVLQEEKRQQVNEAMNRLTAPYRTVLFMRYNMDMSYKEIADALSVPVTTVQVHLHRAKKKMRDMLVQEGGFA
ncbi:sigma-70 family RNA polymerase sigma factor [Paenibacillus sp. OSY-SE]|uniref:sigma-70 family RNA polymerase sigma factor n=1 Tax=Paenibacillus sp. OSY-SE TaxID=1196323 RepID=UPI000560746B